MTLGKYALLFCLLSGCATQFQAVPTSAQPLVSTSQGALSLTAYREAWPGGSLPETVVPVAVELYNSGDKPVRVSYDQFSLRTTSGRPYAIMSTVPLPAQPHPVFVADTAPAIGPRAYEETAVRQSPAFQVEDWSSAPRLPDTAHSPDYWNVVLPWEPYGTGHSPSPSAAVRSAALPEGELAPGARISGFLYFLWPDVEPTTLFVGWRAGEGQKLKVELQAQPIERRS